MSELYKQGFDAGYKFSVENWDPNTGHYSKSLPIEFNHRADSWSCGFGEGLISGRNKILKITFPGFTEISWPNGHAKVSY